MRRAFFFLLCASGCTTKTIAEDAGPPDGGPWACPTDPPAVGSPCPPPLSCEYEDPSACGSRAAALRLRTIRPTAVWMQPCSLRTADRGRVHPTLPSLVRPVLRRYRASTKIPSRAATIFNASSNRRAIFVGPARSTTATRSRHAREHSVRSTRAPTARSASICRATRTTTVATARIAWTTLEISLRATTGCAWRSRKRAVRRRVRESERAATKRDGSVITARAGATRPSSDRTFVVWAASGSRTTNPDATSYPLDALERGEKKTRRLD